MSAVHHLTPEEREEVAERLDRLELDLAKFCEDVTTETEAMLVRIRALRERARTES